jgi:hypothetical protein
VVDRRQRPPLDVWKETINHKRRDDGVKYSVLLNIR